MVQIQRTPNPNAHKFITDRALIAGDGNATFTTVAEAAGVDMAEVLLGIGHVTQVYFFQNTVTVTQDGSGNWEIIGDAAQAAIERLLNAHDPKFPEPVAATDSAAAAPEAAASPEIEKIDEILDRTVRGFLQNDGGDLTVLAYADNYLYVKYEGACGGCPSAAAGTLQAIQGVLRDEFNPEITVIAR